MKSSTNLSDMIKEIRAHFPFANLTAADRTLASSLKKVGGNDYFSVYESESGRSAIGRVELRANFTATPKKQLLALALKSPVSSDLQDVERDLGVKREQMGLVSPHAVERGTYLRFHLPGLEIRVQLNAASQVTGIVFDSIEG